MADVLERLKAALAGRYTIEIGLYDPATGERLPVLDNQWQIAADHLTLTHLMVDGKPRQAD